MKNNEVKMTGTIMAPFVFSHEIHGEGFFSTAISVERFSDTEDVLPLLVSERVVDVTQDYTGERVKVCGCFRSYNSKQDGSKSKVVLDVFAESIDVIDCEMFINNISLDGYICKPVIYRKTPLGREIADVFLAVSRPCGKSDYIPCICWGRNARYAETFGVGTHLKINGRIQSREYQKKLSETECEKRIAYEVSVSNVQVVM